MYYAPSSLRLLFSRLSTLRLLHLFSISFFIPSGPIRLFPKRNSVIFSVISAKLALKSIMPLLPIFLPLMSKIVFISSIQPLMISLTLGVITTPLLSSSPPSVCTPTMQYSLSLPSQKIGAPLWPGLVQIRQSTKASDYLGFFAERQSTAEDSPLYYICFLQLSGCSFADFGQPETVSRLLLSPSRKAQRESKPKQPYLFSRLQKFFSLAKAKSQQSASSSPRVTYSLGNLQPLIQNFSPKSFTSLISFPFSLMVTSCCLKPRVKVAESAFFFESLSQKLWAQVRIHYELMRKAVPLKPLFQNWVYKKPIVVYGYSSMGAYFLLSFRGLRRPEQVRQYPRYEFVHYLRVFRGVSYC